MNDSNDKMDLDLIHMVQKARMAHDSTAQPSNIAAVYWIETKADEGVSAQPTPRSGEWVIETDVAAVDALWETIKTATHAGKLGYKSKVSTASRASDNPNQRVICVRTYDADDVADVGRIRAALLALGIEAGKMQYSRDK